MNHSQSTGSFYPIFAALVTFLAGIALLFIEWRPTATEAYILGFLALLAGVLLVQSMGWVSLLLVFFGVYLMGRGAGIIEQEILRWGLGIPLVLLGGYSLVQLLAKKSGA